MIWQINAKSQTNEFKMVGISIRTASGYPKGMKRICIRNALFIFTFVRLSVAFVHGGTHSQSILFPMNISCLKRTWSDFSVIRNEFQFALEIRNSSIARNMIMEHLQKNKGKQWTYPRNYLYAWGTQTTQWEYYKAA